jgi:MarR family transcriptional regulator, 2-MHQ and catechol-resistance regulon repressor
VSGKRRGQISAELPLAQLELRQVLGAAERFVAAIEARSIALMLRLDLSLPQLRALVVIHRRARANGRQLAAGLRLTPGAIVAICDHLERRGYVQRIPDTADRRVTWFELTEQGAAVFNMTPATTIARMRMKTLLADLSSAEREGFITVANAFAEAIESTLAAGNAEVGEAEPPATV